MGSGGDTETPRLPRRLKRTDLPTEAVALAKALIGKSLVHDLPGGPVGVRIVETEAYPAGDPASWAFRGRTAHNAPLFEGFGHIHVYLSYGVSWLTNITADAGGEGAGVLFRAGEPIWGLDGMMARRKTRRLIDLANGPGKLSAAMKISKKENGASYFDEGPLWIGEAVQKRGQIEVSRRIGISKGVTKPFRFYEAKNPYVSGAKAVPVAR